MKVNELRIGNYVQCLNEDDEKIAIAKIVSIDSVGSCEYPIMVETIIGDSEEYYHQFSGIELTKEWLLKFGFELHGHTYDKGLLSICLKGRIYQNGRTYFNSWCINERMPKYVHELQNLHFALTGEELTIATNER